MASGAIASPERVRAEEFEERGVAQIFFEISALAQIFGINLGNGQPMAAKMP